MKIVSTKLTRNTKFFIGYIYDDVSSRAEFSMY